MLARVCSRDEAYRLYILYIWWSDACQQTRHNYQGAHCSYILYGQKLPVSLVCKCSRINSELRAADDRHPDAYGTLSLSWISQVAMNPGTLCRIRTPTFVPFLFGLSEARGAGTKEGGQVGVEGRDLRRGTRFMSLRSEHPFTESKEDALLIRGRATHSPLGTTTRTIPNMQNHHGEIIAHPECVPLRVEGQPFSQWFLSLMINERISHIPI